MVPFELLSLSTCTCRFTSLIVFRWQSFTLTKERTSVDDRATPGHLHSNVLVGKGSDCLSNYIQAKEREMRNADTEQRATIEVYLHHVRSAREFYGAHVYVAS